MALSKIIILMLKENKNKRLGNKQKTLLHLLTTFIKDVLQ